MIAAGVAALFFACVAFIGVQTSRALCAGVQTDDAGPASATPPYVVLVLAGAVLGGLLVAVGATPLQLGIAAIVAFALVACWCSDALCGIVPDAFTLAPLAALLLFSFAQRDWWIVLSAAIAFAPFAAAAIVTRGSGMGWGDVKLVALCGAALGAPLVVFAMAAACAAAVVGHLIGRGGSRPIAFAPYIAAATALALPFGIGAV
jgi:prepilin signal peptidase PulO-like enzyme (type II secretory pathway)